MTKGKTQQTLAEFRSVLDSLPNRTEDETLAALIKRKEALRSRLHHSEQRIATIQKNLLQAQNAISAEKLAEALLENPSAEMTELQPLRDELDALIQTVDALRLAIQQGEREILHHEAELDAAACRTVSELHRCNVRTTINAMLRLHQAIRAQDDLRVELTRRGIQRTGHLHPFVHNHFVEGPDDIHSWLSGQLRELVGWKFLTEHERLALQQGTLSELDLTDEGDI